MISIPVTIFALLSNLIAYVHIGDIHLDKIRILFILCIHVFIVAMWGGNCMLRVVDKRMRLWFAMIAVMIIFFLLLRVARHQLSSGLTFWNHFLWYLYYVPMLLIPYFSLLIALKVGKPEKSGTSMGFLIVFTAITGCMIMMPLTNDLHGLCFRFYEENYLGEDKYTYGPLYYTAITWMYGMILASLVLIMKKGRVKEKQKRIYIPWVLLAVIIIYFLLYILDVPYVQDTMQLAPNYCLLTGLMLESLIYHRLIPTNQDYEWCFDHASLDMQIFDYAGNVRYASLNAGALEQADIEKMRKSSGALQKDGREYLLHEIRGGYCVSASDTSLLNETNERTKYANDEMERINRTLSESIRIAEERERFEQGNRLYNLCFRETEHVVSYMESLLRAAREAGGDELKEYLGLLNIHGAYVKRRSNLVILNEGQLENAGGELKLCLKETISNLKLFGVKVESSVKELTDIRIRAAILMYDFFEELNLLCLPDVERIYVLLSESGNQSVLTLQYVCGRTEIPLDLSNWEVARVRELSAELSVEDEEEPGCFTVSLRIPVQRGGERS